MRKRLSLEPTELPKEHRDSLSDYEFHVQKMIKDSVMTCLEKIQIRKPASLPPWTPLEVVEEVVRDQGIDRLLRDVWTDAHQRGLHFALDSLASEYHRGYDAAVNGRPREQVHDPPDGKGDGYRQMAYAIMQGGLGYGKGRGVKNDPQDYMDKGTKGGKLYMKSSGQDSLRGKGTSSRGDRKGGKDFTTGAKGKGGNNAGSACPWEN